MSLHVDSAAYKASVHADVSCTDCHADIKDLPHPARLKRVDCSGCHSEVAAVYAKSRHVVAADRKPVVNGPTCADCHGAHAVPKTDPLHLSRSTTGTSPPPAPGATRTQRSPTKRNIGIPGASRMYDQGIHNQAIVDEGAEQVRHVRRLPRRPRHAGAHGPRVLHQQAESPRDVREVPLRRLHHLPGERARDVAGPRGPRRAQLRRLPRRARHPRRPPTRTPRSPSAPSPGRRAPPATPPRNWRRGTGCRWTRCAGTSRATTASPRAWATRPWRTAPPATACMRSSPPPIPAPRSTRRTFPSPAANATPAPRRTSPAGTSTWAPAARAEGSSSGWSGSTSG